MLTTYEQDVVKWSEEQAALLRQRDFSHLDIEHIAEEVEDVGKSEQRELMSHMVVLLAHLLKWEYQPERRGASWEKTIKAQRIEIAFNIKETPSLKTRLENEAWQQVVWAKAVSAAVAETDLDIFPEESPWTMQQVLSNEFFPGNNWPDHGIPKG